MKISTKVNLKCIRCGGVKYIDDPYLISSVWYVDIVCLSCGDSKSTEAEEFQKTLKKIERSGRVANR